MTSDSLQIICILVGISLILPCSGMPLKNSEELEIREDLEKWFYDDTNTSTDNISEGELVYISPTYPNTILHSQNQLTITPESIKTGWVNLQQCYANLAPIMETQVVYQYKFMRNLIIISSTHIDRAWVEGKSVQLYNVQEDAELCIHAQVRILYQNPDRSFTLISGPYYLKFLDGYYPLHISFSVTYPNYQLRFTGMEPANPIDLLPLLHAGKVSIDTFFEGQLTIKMNFQAIK